MGAFAGQDADVEAFYPIDGWIFRVPDMIPSQPCRMPRLKGFKRLKYKIPLPDNRPDGWKVR
jgi:hypothetical protein